jgi:hypothetical protein
MDYGYYGLCAVMMFLVLMFMILGKEYHKTRQYNLKQPIHPFPDTIDSANIDSLMYENSESLRVIG